MSLILQIRIYSCILNKRTGQHSAQPSAPKARRGASLCTFLLSGRALPPPVRESDLFCPMVPCCGDMLSIKTIDIHGTERADSIFPWYECRSKGLSSKEKGTSPKSIHDGEEVNGFCFCPSVCFSVCFCLSAVCSERTDSSPPQLTLMSWSPRGLKQATSGFASKVKLCLIKIPDLTHGSSLVLVKMFKNTLQCYIQALNWKCPKLEQNQ